MVEAIITRAWSCTCEHCGHVWISLSQFPPRSCTHKGCRSRAWNGTKRNGRPPHAPSSLKHLPAVTKVRELEEL